MKKLIIILFFFSLAKVFAQDVNSYIELLRSDVNTEKKALITEVMKFSEEDASIFWPIYKGYEFKLDKLGDKRVANIKDYAENYMNMTDEKADAIIKQAFDYQSERLDLKKDIYNELKEKLNPSQAAKFIQLDNLIQLLIDLQINANLPLLEKTSSDTEGK
jgi:hypothetical protein